eukprot:CAMPEP_0197689478 /NCGR_PEP_ID=MMETSP1338-20131121/106896_1 /TAXON_ID=43686 ORGANISM="Pelagodinium beii, Strain RCC1491" /NCGR_SAMPLE_ID=MMETSP1338 /ASSEMBLY_ACC=CAM_ASM_000754 /LENGTH=282 /DNA_ID=CAMNT_0043271815 /DNA_START=285 /DNA_END=1129 /DNA_ORIENTATION=-
MVCRCSRCQYEEAILGESEVLEAFRKEMQALKDVTASVHDMGSMSTACGTADMFQRLQNQIASAEMAIELASSTLKSCFTPGKHLWLSASETHGAFLALSTRGQAFWPRQSAMALGRLCEMAEEVNCFGVDHVKWAMKRLAYLQDAAAEGFDAELASDIRNAYSYAHHACEIAFGNAPGWWALFAASEGVQMESLSEAPLPPAPSLKLSGHLQPSPENEVDGREEAIWSPPIFSLISRISCWKIKLHRLKPHLLLSELNAFIGPDAVILDVKHEQQLRIDLP